MPTDTVHHAIDYHRLRSIMPDHDCDRFCDCYNTGRRIRMPFNYENERPKKF